MTIQPLGPPSYNELFGPVTAKTTQEVLRWTIGRLRDGGLAPHPECRLTRAERILTDAASDPERLIRDTNLRRVVADIQRTSVEFSAIANCLPPGGTVTPRLRKQFQKAYGGDDDPLSVSPTGVAARNMQFELYLNAWFAAGRKPVRTGEPDLQVQYDSGWHGVAAKRVRSANKIKGHLKKGAEQIRNATGAGFIAVAVDDYAYAERMSEGDVETVGKRFFSAMPELADGTNWLQRKAPWVLGLLCFGRIARWDLTQSPPKLQLDNLVHLVGLETADERVAYFRAYFEEHARQFNESWRIFSGG